jgi:hypothetical protein
LQTGPALARHVALLDKNKDLWLYAVRDPKRCAKLGAMAVSFSWHTHANLLVGLTGGRLVQWLHPAAALVDPLLEQRMRVETSANEFGGSATVSQCSGCTLVVRRGDGATVPVGFAK